MRLKIPYITTNIETDIVNTVYLAPLWWILGFSFFIYHAVSFWIIFKLIVISIKNRETIKIPKQALFLLFFIIVYGISLSINYPHNELQRTIASLFNFSFWIMGFILILAVYNSFDVTSIHKLARALCFNIIFIGILSIMLILLWFAGHDTIEFRSAAAILFPQLENIPNIKGFVDITLLRTDIFMSMALPRVGVVAHHPKEMASFILLSMPLAYAYYHSKDNKKAFEQVFLLSLGMLGLLFTFSRITIVSLIITITAVYLLNKRNRVLLIIFLLAITILTFPYLMEMFNLLNEMRAQSSAARFGSYEYVLKLVRSNIFIGLGIKPWEERFYVPIGSHSTYLGILLRTGIIGLAMFILFQVHIFRNWLKLQKLNTLTKPKHSYGKYIGISLIGVSFDLFATDLDIPRLMCFSYFIIVGIFCVLRRGDNFVPKDDYGKV